MKRYMLFIALLISSLDIYSKEIKTPSEFFGFQPGTDRMLITYEQLTGYLTHLDSLSDRLKMIRIGTSPMGKPMYAACFSSPRNLDNLDRLKEINRKLALDYTMPENEVTSLVQEGKVFVLATMSMHSGEVAPSQSVPIVAWEWVTSSDPEITQALDNVVFMIVPCHNPDGMDMVVEDYLKTKGTIYEGSPLPGVYHKYVGHDNNRDFIVLTQSDTKAISKLTSTEWFPQVLIEKHQMGSTGPRYFVPPNHDPIAENVDAELFIWTGIFGQQMISDLTGAGLKGVSQHTLFDNYWPGSTETCIWKNVIALLTEAASCQVAKPIYIEPTELTAEGKGLAEYKKSINMPDPWPGGWWRLGDIVQYEIVSTNTMLKTTSVNREKILRLRNDLCKSEVKKGQTEAPYYFLLPAEQSDKSELTALVRLLVEHGIAVYTLTHDISLGQTSWKKGDVVVPLAQPFRAFIKEVMESQKYPERHYIPGGELIEPYDITTWSLPLHMGLKCVKADSRNTELESSLARVDSSYTLAIPYRDAASYILPVTDNGSYKIAFIALHKGIPVSRNSQDTVIAGIKVPAGSFIIEKGQGTEELIRSADFPVIYSDQAPGSEWNKIHLPRIALVETWFHDMDAGWTRYILDTYGVDYTVLRPGEMTSGAFTGKFDLLVFPDDPASVLKDGKYKDKDQYYLANYRPEFTKGMGAKGVDTLLAFINGGGKVISWGESTALFDANFALKSKGKTDDFRLPFHDVSSDVSMKDLNCPGSLIRMNLFRGTPLTAGMGTETGIFFRGRPVFTTSIPHADMNRRVVGYFGENELLMSGFIYGEKLLANKSAMVWINKGKGSLVLMGFSPIFRASVPATYKLFFNSLLLDEQIP
jgi:hypothetical protein